ncbi:MAG: hypothetical protein GY928_22255 [Colwellia sp.]|nr:hypothetical protein [Colwellia sp.]
MFKYTKECREISGFGGFYEEACRNATIKGYEFMIKIMKGEKIESIKFNDFIDLNDGNKKTMESVILEACNNDATGAMMNVIASHIVNAYCNGWDEYIKTMEEN